MNDYRIPIIIITGPTAIGKTNVAINLSTKIPLEIISADSRQIYKYLDIGTAKPSKNELSLVKHYFIDELNPDEYFSAGIFLEKSNQIIQEIVKRNKIPLIVGGTGLYIKALTDGLFEENIKYNKLEIRNKIENILNDFGKEKIISELERLDRTVLDIYPDKNLRRLVRALEYIYGTGNKFSKDYILFSKSQNYNYLYIVLNDSRENIYNRINFRAEKMWNDGLISETESIIKMGYNPSLNSLNTVGYKEAISYINQNISEARAIELIQQNTRRYAKRQITWFKSVEEAIWVDVNQTDLENHILNIILNHLNKD